MWNWKYAFTGVNGMLTGENSNKWQSVGLFKSMLLKSHQVIYLKCIL